MEAISPEALKRAPKANPANTVLPIITGRKTTGDTSFDLPEIDGRKMMDKNRANILATPMETKLDIRTKPTVISVNTTLMSPK